MRSNPLTERYLGRKVVTRGELLETARENDALWWHGSDGTLKLDAVGVDDDTLVDPGVYTMKDRFVCEIRNAELVGRYPLTVSEDGDYVLENAFDDIGLLTGKVVKNALNGPTRRNTADGFDTAVALVGMWDYAYFHWFADWLPRLEGVERYAEETGREPPLVIPRDPPDWLTDSLRLVGYSPDRFVEWNGSGATVDRLVIPSVRHAEQTRLVRSPSGYRWVRERMLGNVDVSDTDDASRIFVSRDDASERRVVNEDEVVDVLDEFGFARYVLSELDLEEQMDLFSRADAVVAPHGAGLVNLLYADDPVVVELFGEYPYHCYYTLAESLGFEYACLQCTPKGVDMEVDVDDLRRLVDGLVD